MNSHAPRRFVALLCLVLATALGTAAVASAASKVEGIFPIGNLEAGNKLVEGPEGNIWMTVNTAGKDVARITPAGKVEEFDLENVSAPSGIAVGPEKMLWVTQSGGVAKFSPLDLTKVTTQAIAQIKSGASIVAGPDKDLWVATEDFAIQIPPAEPAKFNPIPIAELRPHDIDAAGSLLAIADAEKSRIVTLTTAGTETDFAIDGSSQGVAGAPGGQIAFSQQGHEPEQFGLLTPPAKPVVTSFAGVDPFGIALGSDGAFWGVESSKDAVARITPKGESTVVGGLPKGSMPRQIAAGPGNTMWVTLEKAGETAVARIVGLEPASSGPQTTIVKGPSLVKTKRRTARVSFAFKSSTAGSTFQCALARINGDKQTKAVFKACSSPKTFTLRPGRYRFAVRAIAAGSADATPAVRGLRVVRARGRRR